MIAGRVRRNGPGPLIFLAIEDGNLPPIPQESPAYESLPVVFARLKLGIGNYRPGGNVADGPGPELTTADSTKRHDGICNDNA